MARITVEDCIDKFPSRFELVLVASNRARKLYSGEDPTVEKDNDKNTVIALREIAQETITQDQLKNDLIEEYQTTSISDDEDLIEQENQTEEDKKTDDFFENSEINQLQSSDLNKSQEEEINNQEIVEDAIDETTEDTSENTNENDLQNLEENSDT